MLIVRFQGGLGNQMFQNCFLEYLRRFSDDVVADLSEYNGISYHNGFELSSVFESELKTAKWIDIVQSANSFHIPHRTIIGLYADDYLRRMMIKYNTRKGNKQSHIYEKQFINLSNEEISELILIKKKLYFDGFWFYKYIYDAADLQKIFKFRQSVKNKGTEYAKIIDNTNSCSIHIRLGDYVNNKEFGILNVDYYDKAIQHVKNIIHDAVFFVFSDDINAAKRILGTGTDFKYIESPDRNDSGVDMYLMSCCKNNIIANSSYSFWGAKLNSNENKMVIAPKMLTIEKVFKPAFDEKWIII